MTVVAIFVVVIGGVDVASGFIFFPDFRRLHPRTAEAMTDTTMMHKKVMNKRPEVLVSVTQMDGPSPDVC